MDLRGVLQGKDNVTVVWTKGCSLDSEGFPVAFHGFIFISAFRVDRCDVVENDCYIAMRISEKRPSDYQTLQEAFHCHLM
jgi:hypothetical protein